VGATMEKHKKIAFLSHILPPDPSGQSVMLYRLIQGIPDNEYFMISCKNYLNKTNNPGTTQRLPGQYFSLEPIMQAPVIKWSILKEFCILLNALWGILRRTKQIKGILKKKGPCSLLIACTGDLYDLPAGYLASKQLGIPFIPYIFDYYAYHWAGFGGALSRLMEPMLLKNASGVIVTNECMQKEYLSRYKVPSIIIHNPCTLPNLKEAGKNEKIFDPMKKNIVYTGSIYHAHYDAFCNLIKAIQKLKRDDIILHLYCSQPESLLKRNGIRGTMVRYHPHIVESEVSRVLRQADILFLPLAFNSPIPRLVNTSSPGKIGDYLSVARPILVHAPHNSFLSWFFYKNKCGIVVDKDDPQLLASELEKLLTQKEQQMKLGKFARQTAEQYFDIGHNRVLFWDYIKSFI